MAMGREERREGGKEGECGGRKEEGEEGRDGTYLLARSCCRRLSLYRLLLLLLPSLFLLLVHMPIALLRSHGRLSWADLVLRPSLLSFLLPLVADIHNVSLQINVCESS